MASLTVTFKGKSLNSVRVEQSEISIGRDPQNTVPIDSLAIAPRHAVIRLTEHSFTLEPVADGYPTFVNGRPVTSHELRHGDRIDIGKHTLYFSAEQFLTELLPVEEPAKTESDFLLNDSALKAIRGTLQIVNGPEIGVIIPLQQAMTRLPFEGGEGAAIVREDEGFVLCCLGDDLDIAVNGHPVSVRSERLKDGDMIRLNETILQFHLERSRGGNFDVFP